MNELADVISQRGANELSIAVHVVEVSCRYHFEDAQEAQSIIRSLSSFASLTVHVVAKPHSAPKRMRLSIHFIRPCRAAAMRRPSRSNTDGINARTASLRRVPRGRY